MKMCVFVSVCVREIFLCFILSLRSPLPLQPSPHPPSLCMPAWFRHPKRTMTKIAEEFNPRCHCTQSVFGWVCVCFVFVLLFGLLWGGGGCGGGREGVGIAQCVIFFFVFFFFGGGGVSVLFLVGVGFFSSNQSAKEPSANDCST